VKALEGEALSCCLTQTYFEDRVIRTSRLQRVPNRGLWLATANDPSLTPEIARRTIGIHLDAGREQEPTNTPSPEPQ
jgi:putative DNA primase/helicase